MIFALATAVAQDPCELTDFEGIPRTRVCSEPGCCTGFAGTCVDDPQEAVDLAVGPTRIELEGTLDRALDIDGKVVRLTPPGTYARWVDPVDAPPDSPVITVRGGSRVCVVRVDLDLSTHRGLDVDDSDVTVLLGSWSSTWAPGNANYRLPVFLSASSSSILLDGTAMEGAGVSFGRRASHALSVSGGSLHLHGCVVRDTHGVLDAGLTTSIPSHVRLDGDTELRDNHILGGDQTTLLAGTGVLEIDGVRVVDNDYLSYVDEPTGAGLIRWRGDIDVRSASFIGNRSPSGAVLQWYGGGEMLVERTGFCGNTSESLFGVRDVRVLEILASDTADRAHVRNSRFVGNDGGLWSSTVEGSRVTIHNNAMIGNRAPVGSVVDGERYGFGVTGPSEETLFTNNLVVANADVTPRAGGLSVAGGVALHHNLWWGNTPNRRPEILDLAALTSDPVLAPGVSCALLGPSDVETGRGAWFGPTKDAGDGTAVVGVTEDLDGSALDIGPFGGPDAAPSAWVDADGDGVPHLFDCDDGTPTVGGGLYDAPYDGVDADCRGDDDYDADHDGHRSSDWGGDDCDDDDPGTHPEAVEVPANGRDDDCDGWSDEGDALGSRGCSSVPVGFHVSVLAMLGRRAGGDACALGF